MAEPKVEICFHFAYQFRQKFKVLPLFLDTLYVWAILRIISNVISDGADSSVESVLPLRSVFWSKEATI